VHDRDQLVGPCTGAVHLAIRQCYDAPSRRDSRPHLAVQAHLSADLSVQLLRSERSRPTHEDGDESGRSLDWRRVCEVTLLSVFGRR
jgi:hypothetical protein